MLIANKDAGKQIRDDEFSWMKSDILVRALDVDNERM
jgi:hypothetical protein